MRQNFLSCTVPYRTVPVLPGAHYAPLTPASAQRPRFLLSYHLNSWRRCFPDHHVCKMRSQTLFLCDPSAHLWMEKWWQWWLQAWTQGWTCPSTESETLPTEHCSRGCAHFQQVNCVFSSEAQHAVAVHVAAARAVPVRRSRKKPLVHPGCSEGKAISKKKSNFNTETLPAPRQQLTPFIHPCCFLVCPPVLCKNPPPHLGLAKISRSRQFPKQHPITLRWCTTDQSGCGTGMRVGTKRYALHLHQQCRLSMKGVAKKFYLSISYIKYDQNVMFTGMKAQTKCTLRIPNLLTYWKVTLLHCKFFLLVKISFIQAANES